MSLKMALLTVVVWGVTFAAIGGLLGTTLGVLAPDYYRSLFAHGRSAEFQPVQVGAGLGLTQGFAVGVAVALAVLVLMTWRETRLASAAPTSSPSERSGEAPSRVRRAVWGAAVVALVGLTGVVAFTAGGFVGQQQLYQAWTDQKVRRLEQVLASREFPDVRPGYSSAAQVYVQGNVPNAESKRALRELLARSFGAEEAEFMVGPVDVAVAVVAPRHGIP